MSEEESLEEIPPMKVEVITKETPVKDYEGDDSDEYFEINVDKKDIEEIEID